MYRKIRWLAGLLILIGLSKLAFSATHPDLALAPPPNLSPVAWNELQHGQTDVKTISLHAQITAQHGSIADVTVKEASQFPQTAVLEQTGPPELCTFTVNWVRRTWVPEPNIQLSVYRCTTFTVATDSSRNREQLGNLEFLSQRNLARQQMERSEAVHPRVTPVSSSDRTISDAGASG